MAQKTLVQLSRGSSLSTVSIIGSAGRRGDAIKMTRELYWNMVDKAQCVISEHFKLDPGRVHLVSGGAAWAGALNFAEIILLSVDIILYRSCRHHIVHAREGSCLNTTYPSCLGVKK